MLHVFHRASVGIFKGFAARGTVIAFAAAALLLTSHSPARAAAVNLVQSGSYTLAGTTGTVTLGQAVDETKAFLVFGASVNTGAASDENVAGQLTDPNTPGVFDTISFSRLTGATNAAIHWYVIEFASGVTVQRGTTAINGGGTATLSPAVDLTKSFPIISFRNNSASGQMGADDFVRAKITATDTLSLFNGGNNVVEWQVVEYADSVVQTGDITLLNSSDIQNDTLTAVDLSKTWLVYSANVTTTTQSNPDMFAYRGQFTTATNVQFDRVGTTARDGFITWYAIEFTDTTNVFSGEQGFTNAGTNPVNVLLATPVDTSLAIAGSGYLMKGGRSTTSNTDNYGIAWFTQNLTSSTNLRLERSRNDSTANFAWQVVEFPPDCTPTTPTVTVAPASLIVPVAAGIVNYTITVQNNDVDAGCSPVDFALTANTTGGTNSAGFTAGILGTPVTVAPGGSNTAVLQVSHVDALDGETIINDVTASATGYTAATSNSVTTTYSEAPYVRVGNGSPFALNSTLDPGQGPVNLNAFGLTVENGSGIGVDEDTITDITVALSGNSDQVSAVEIWNNPPSAMVTSLTRVGATENWSGTGLSLIATDGDVNQYMVRVSANASVPSGTYPISATVTSVTSQNSNPIVYRDGSTGVEATVTIDARNNTIVGGMSFPTVAFDTISVRVPYSADGNRNNTCTIAYGTDGATYPTTLTTSNDRDANRCEAIAINLASGTTYYFQASFVDGDGQDGPVTGMATTTEFSLIHNSDATSSQYWSTNGWGIAGGKYGNFSCGTCHEADPANGNIKRIKQLITAPDATGGDFPGAATNVVAQFANTDYGDNLASTGKVCETCHSLTAVYKNNVANDGAVEHPSYTDPTYDYKACVRCHKHNKAFKLNGGCIDCHDANPKYPTSSPAAPVIIDIATSPYGGHLLAANGEDASFGTYTEEDWNNQCLKCHDGHKGDLMIPNDPRVGINYLSSGGIQLGGKSTTGTTEAEICWNCHDNNGISEWNSTSSFNGYSITGGSDWTAVSFDGPGIIPNRATVSIHTANAIDTDATTTNVRASSVGLNVDGSGRTSNHASFGGTKTLEQVQYIRCSYCHDVHNTHGPDKDTTYASTYLRGTWLNNPYYPNGNPERPPTLGDVYGTDNQWNPAQPGTLSHNTSLPRLMASSDASKMPGGFYIDQNSGYPTNAFIDNGNRANELTNTAGVCTPCHDTDVDNMDEYPSSLWRDNITFPDHTANGTVVNGHSNSTLGGNGSNASDIFDPRRGGAGNNMYMGAQDGLAFSNWGEGRAEGSGPFRTDIRDGGKPGEGNSNPPPKGNGWYGGTEGGNLRDGEWSNWYAGNSIGLSPGDTVQSGRAHDFSCSKCHTPHASGLPALLITNCLDVELATYTNTTGNDPVGPGVATPTAYASRVMNNCHRKENNTTTGWHRLTGNQ